MVLPDGTSFELGPATPGGQNGGQPGGANQLDAFQKSDKWLPSMPTIDAKKFQGRLEEITNFEAYVESLVSWVGLISDSFANEIAFSVRAAAEIRQEDLTAQQVSRGLRLLNILKSVFQPIPKASMILSAYTERHANFAVNGFEALRRLSREFSVRTRSEAMHFRSQIMSKTYKVSTVTELVNAMDYDVHRYAKLIGSLGPNIDRNGLDILPIDLSMILLRSLKTQVRQYVVMHSRTEDYADIRQAALRYESSQRLWQEVSSDPKNDNYYANAALKGKGKGDKKGDDKGKGKGDKKGDGKGDKKGDKGGKGKSTGDGKAIAKPTDVCWNCGKTGHFGRDCRAPKSSSDESKGKGKGKKDKGKNDDKGKGRGKGGKAHAAVGEVQQPETEATSTPLISSILFRQAPFDFAGDFKSLTNKTNKFCLWSSNLCQIHVGSHCCLCFDALQHVTDAVCCASLFCESCDCTEIRQKPLLCCGVQFGDCPADCEWWLLDSGASYSVLSSEASKHYKIVGSAPFPKGIGDFFGG